MTSLEMVMLALGHDELRLAQQAADQDGVSLSSFVASAVRAKIEDRGRLDAARAVLATFSPDELPTDTEQRELLALWSPPQPAKPRSRKRR